MGARRALGLAFFLLPAGAFLDATSPRTWASCSQPRPLTATSGGTTSWIYVEGRSCTGTSCSDWPVSTELSGVFWAIGHGLAGPGGNDNGTHGTYYWTWWWSGDPPYPLTISGYGWTEPGVDGCLDAAGPPGTSCTAVALFDEYDPPGGSTSQGHFALVTARSQPSGVTSFAQAGGASIVLRPLPRAWVEMGEPYETFLIRLPDPNGSGNDALYLDPTCPQNLIVGFHVYGLATGGGSPTDRSRSAWTRLTDEPLSFDTHHWVASQPCASNQTQNVAISLVFEGGFETDHVSAQPFATVSHPSCCPTDADGDGWCPGPLHHDCDDTDPDVRPFVPDLCNGIDDNCNNSIDEDVFPEACNGLDDDCDGNVDGHDADGDGIAATCDNCSGVANPEQIDTDGDARGDACDNCPLFGSTSQLDDDLDGRGNDCDNCVLDPNPDQTDRDADEQGDACDLDDGLIRVAFHEPDLVEWQDESGYDAWNLYRGDLSALRATGVYTQDPGSVPLAARHCGLSEPWVIDGDPPAGDTAFYLVTGTLAGTSTEGDLGQDSTGAGRPNTNPCP
jgi:hypothetical protein